MVRYAFTAEDFHLIPPAGLPAHPSTPSFARGWDGPRADCLLTDERYEERTLKNGLRPARSAAERKPILRSVTKSGMKRMPASTRDARGGLALGLRSKP